MELDTGTFCAAAWFQIRNDQSGEYRSCCVIDHSKSNFDHPMIRWPQHTPIQYFNDDYTKLLRQHLTQGNRLPECHRCWESEDLGNQSLRQKINHDMVGDRDLSDSWIKSYLKNKTDYESDLLLSVDVKLTNTCNFSCAMCYPWDSSKVYTSWYQSKDHPVIHQMLQQHPGVLEQVRETYFERNNHELLKHALCQQPKQIKILGGEPLMDQQALEILDQVPLAQKQTTRLIFVTNGSQNLCAAHDRLKDYKDINFVVSLEGMDQIQDFIRRGSDWHQISSHILEFKSKYPQCISISTTLQAMNLLHLDRLVEWTSSNDLRLGFNLLKDPEFLSISSMPPRLRELIPTNLYHRKITQDERPGLDIISLLSLYPYDPVLHQQFLRYLDWYAPNTWREILPEWTDQ